MAKKTAEVVEDDYSVVSTDEAAQMLNVFYTTIGYYKRKGLLKPVGIGKSETADSQLGRPSCLFKRSDVLNLKRQIETKAMNASMLGARRAIAIDEESYQRVQSVIKRGLKGGIQLSQAAVCMSALAAFTDKELISMAAEFEEKRQAVKRKTFLQPA